MSPMGHDAAVLEAIVLPHMFQEDVIFAPPRGH